MDCALVSNYCCPGCLCPDPGHIDLRQGSDDYLALCSHHNAFFALVVSRLLNWLKGSLSGNALVPQLATKYSSEAH